MDQFNDKDLISRFAGFVTRELGLLFQDDRVSDLKRGIALAASDFGFHDVHSCMKWLMSAPLSHSQAETLARHLTVGETYFYRDRACFEILERELLPGLIDRRSKADRTMRIWSAGCCSGEEAYSIAISVMKVLPALQDWKVTIVGSDINPDFLSKAAGGTYSQWSFRGLSDEFKSQYFTRTPDSRWMIKPAIRNMVTFMQLNLMQNTLPSPMNMPGSFDLIFCRNVLIYFSAAQARRVVSKLADCLAMGGWLVLGSTDGMCVTSTGLVLGNYSGAQIYQKRPFSPLRLSRATSSVTTPAQETPVPHTIAVHDYLRATWKNSPELPCEPEIPAHTETVTSSTESDLQLARDHANQGQLAEALSTCDMILASHRTELRAHYLRASVLMELGSLQEAETAYHRVLYLEPDFILAHFGLGHLKRQQNDSAESERHFRNALTLSRKQLPGDLIPEGEGMTFAELSEIILALQSFNTRLPSSG